MSAPLDFNALVAIIEQTHSHFQQQAVKAVNVSLIVRNWLVGHYIVEFEQYGEERALYGEKLISNLAEKLSVNGLGETNLKICRLFYKTYPEIGKTVHLHFGSSLPLPIRQTVSAEFKATDVMSLEKSRTASDEFQTPHPLMKSDQYYHDLLERTGMDNQLFVSQYMLELPKKEELEAFILKEVATWG